MSVPARNSKAQRIRAKRKSGKASDKELDWLAQYEDMISGGGGDEPSPPSGPPLATADVTKGPPEAQKEEGGSEAAAQEPPSFVQQTDPAYQPRFAYSPGMEQPGPNPRPEEPPPPSSPPPPPPPPPPTGNDAAPPPPPESEPGPRMDPPKQEHETPPPPGFDPNQQQDPRVKQWREIAAIKITSQLGKLHEKMEARGWPALTPAEAEELYDLLPWAINDYLHEKFPDVKTTHKDFRNVILGVAVGGTVGCVGLGYMGEAKKKKAAAEAAKKGRSEQASDEQPEPPAAPPAEDRGAEDGTGSEAITIYDKRKIADIDAGTSLFSA